MVALLQVTVEVEVVVLIVYDVCVVVVITIGQKKRPPAPPLRAEAANREK